MLLGFVLGFRAWGLGHGAYEIHGCSLGSVPAMIMTMTTKLPKARSIRSITATTVPMAVPASRIWAKTGLGSLE